MTIQPREKKNKVIIERMGINSQKNYEASKI